MKKKMSILILLLCISLVIPTVASASWVSAGFSVSSCGGTSTKGLATGYSDKSGASLTVDGKLTKNGSYLASGSGYGSIIAQYETSCYVLDGSVFKMEAKLWESVGANIYFYYDSSSMS